MKIPFITCFLSHFPAVWAVFSEFICFLLCRCEGERFVLSPFIYFTKSGLICRRLCCVCSKCMDNNANENLCVYSKFNAKHTRIFRSGPCACVYVAQLVSFPGEIWIMNRFSHMEFNKMFVVYGVCVCSHCMLQLPMKL